MPTDAGAPELAFGAVLRRVADARAPRKTVCIGCGPADGRARRAPRMELRRPVSVVRYVTAEGDQQLAPALSAARSYVPGDRLVLITRP